MHNMLKCVFFILLCATGVPGQTGGVSAVERMMAATESRFAALEKEKERSQRWHQRRFAKRAQRFVRLWNAFVDDYNRGVVDLGKIREVSKAFREMEKAGKWPVADNPAKPSTPSARRNPPKTASPPGGKADAR